VGAPLTWVARTQNLKTDDVPTAYVGATVAECRETCAGCPLLEKRCYAWSGRARQAMGRHEARRRADPWSCSLERALELRNPLALIARIGAMGDPARADPVELAAALALLAAEGLVPVSYTHFWREPWADHVRGLCMASCGDEAEALEAIGLGWTPAPILPWDHAGKTFRLPDGRLGLVCPAQVRETTCNDCRLCWLGHPIWAAGKVAAVGFLDHSRAANRERRLSQGGRQLPVFDRMPDLRLETRRTE